MIRIILFLALTISGCNSKDKTNNKDRNETYAIYGIMVGKYSSSNVLLQNEIYATINKFDIVENKEARIYDSLTVRYYKYLESIFHRIEDAAMFDLPTDYTGELSNEKLINDLFFERDNSSSLGKEYLSKREEYKTQILNLVKNDKISYQISNFFKDDEEIRSQGKLSHLDFYFKDIPPIGVMAYLKYIQHSILEFENEFVKNKVFQKLNSSYLQRVPVE